MIVAQRPRPRRSDAAPSPAVTVINVPRRSTLTTDHNGQQAAFPITLSGAEPLLTSTGALRRSRRTTRLPTSGFGVRVPGGAPSLNARKRWPVDTCRSSEGVGVGMVAHCLKVRGRRPVSSCTVRRTERPSLPASLRVPKALADVYSILNCFRPSRHGYRKTLARTSCTALLRISRTLLGITSQGFEMV